MRNHNRNPNSNVSPQLGARLLAARLQAGLTQTVLSVRAGVSVSTIQRAELYGAATTRTLAALARALNVPIDDLTRLAGKRGRS